ncbi:MAG: DUF2723 domain-containing protein [Myxococcota bacterium]|nr:DUF2723 domain-containing protein [Myxococcota bacterium]
MSGRGIDVVQVNQPLITDESNSAWLPLVFGCISCLLIFLAAPGLTWLDAGELMAASHELGIAHPPGFPLFNLVHKFIVMCIPMGEIAFRGNLASALIGAGGITVLAACGRRMGLQPVAVACASMMVLSAPVFVLHASSIEVYTGVLLGVGILLWLWIDWVHAQDKRSGLLFAFVLGLFVGGHHPEFRLLGPVMLASALVYARPRIKSLVAPFIAGVWGCGVIAYLPIRASTAPWRNWGDPSTLNAVWDHFWAARIRAAYSGQMGQFDLEVLSTFGGQVSGPFGVFIVVGGLGLILVSRTPIGRTLLAILVADVFYSVFINPMGVRDAQNGIMTVVVLIAGVAVSFHQLLKSRFNHWLLGVGLGIYLTCTVIENHAKDNGLPTLLDDLQATAPIDALVMVSSDHLAAGLAYRQVVEIARPDMAVIVRQHASYESSVGPVKRRLPFALPRWQPGQSLGEFAHLHGRWPLLWEWSAGLDSTVRPKDLRPQFPLFSRGVGTMEVPFDPALNRLDLDVQGNNFIAIRTLASLRTDWAQYLITQNQLSAATLQFGRAAELEPTNPKRWNNLGVSFSMLGQLDRAISATRRALEISPDDGIAQTNLARYILAQGDMMTAQTLLEEVVRNQPTASAWALLGTIAGNRGEQNRARECFEHALRLDPGQPEAKLGLDTLMRQP